ncbi:Ig-like domain-containing protein [Methylomagnum sp.]
MQRGLLASAVALACGNAVGAEHWLCAGTFNKILPDASSVAMWGYADATNTVGHACPANGNAAYTSPGPRLTVLPGDASGLTVHLRNNLPGETSLVIPGQTAAMTPVKWTSGPYNGRVRSFTHETPPGGTADYVWANPRPGSYAYQSGTHPQVQIQMGLFGAMTRDQATNTAYTGVGYTTEVLQFYSEIDPALHAAVAGGGYGPAGGMTSTVNYNPKWFLVNGAPFVDPSPATPATLPAGNVGGNTLLRFFNMGLRSHTLMLQGASMKLVAEDGRLQPVPHEQYSLMIGAGKTHDALFTPTAAGTFPLYERMHNLSVGVGGGQMKTGGMMSFLAVGAATTGPVGNPDAFTTNEDTALTGNVLTNDTPPAGLTAQLVTGPTHALSFALNPNGSFAYTPALNYNGPDGFVYRASNGTVLSANTTASITVTPVNDPPTLNAIPSPRNATVGTPFSYTAVGGDVDAGSVLTYSLVTAPGWLTINPASGLMSGTPAAANIGSSTVTVRVADNGTPSLAATQSFTLNVAGTAPTSTVYFSTLGDTNPPGVTGTADNADHYAWNGTAFSRAVDVTTIANPVPGIANVDGLQRVDNTHFYLSFNGNESLPGLGTVQDEDIVFYNGGTWSVYFDATARGLTQNLDAFTIAGTTVYFSTAGNTNPPGVTGTGDNADIYAWNGTAFSRVVDVTAIPNPVPASANVDGLKFVDATHFYVSFDDNVALPGLGTVQDEDIVYYNNGTWTVYFDGTARGLTNANHDIDALDIVPLP